MSSIPAGQRPWKCPECGKEQLLSVTQLDPLACDDCLAVMKSAGKSDPVGALSNAVSGPFGIWQSLPDATKLAAVVLALVVGSAIGYVVGHSMASPTEKPVTERRHRSAESATPRETESEPGGPVSTSHREVEEDRPASPGPGYKWVQGRKRKDGTRGEGKWVLDKKHAEHAKDDPSEEK